MQRFRLSRCQRQGHRRASAMQAVLIGQPSRPFAQRRPPRDTVIAVRLRSSANSHVTLACASCRRCRHLRGNRIPHCHRRHRHRHHHLRCRVLHHQYRCHSVRRHHHHLPGRHHRPHRIRHRRRHRSCHHRHAGASRLCTSCWAGVGSTRNGAMGTKRGSGAQRRATMRMCSLLWVTFASVASMPRYKHAVWATPLPTAPRCRRFHRASRRCHRARQWLRPRRTRRRPT